MLTESEIIYLKNLLKEKTHNYWREKTTLNDLHRHCKYTIRKLTRQMANIDNYQIFKRLKEPTREHTLYMVYRAERMYSAMNDSNKIFQLICSSIYDEEEFSRIINDKSIKKEDQIFVKERMRMFRRIQSQMSVFLEDYKLFENKFVFKGQSLSDYVEQQVEKVENAIKGMDKIKKENPELAAAEMKRIIVKKQRERKVKNEKEDSPSDVNSPKVNELASPTPSF